MSTININLTGVAPIGDIFYNGDGTITTNRIVDCDNNTLSFENGTVFIFEATNAPTGGDASFNINGYGTTSSDVIERVTNGAATTIYELLGDGQFSYGASDPSYLGSITSSIGGLYVNSATTGIRSIGVSVGVQGEGNVAVYGIGTSIGVQGSGVYGGYFQSPLAESTANRAVMALGGAYIESFGVNGTPETSAILEARSTTKGALMPRMTESEMNAITSPAIGLEVFNTTREEKMVYTTDFGWHPCGEIRPYWGMYNYEKVQPTQNGAFAVYNSVSGGTSGSALLNASISPQRVSAFSTATSATGEYRRNTGSFFLGATGIKQYKTAVSFDTLSDATNRYVALVGMFGFTNGLGATGGYGFCYDEGGVFASATASPNWLCISRAAGAYTVVDSLIPVTTTASGAMQDLEVRDDGTGAHIEFFINGTSVGVITTNIPPNTQAIGVGEKIAKQAGTTARLMYVDYSEYKEKFNTAR